MPPPSKTVDQGDELGASHFDELHSILQYGSFVMLSVKNRQVTDCGVDGHLYCRRCYRIIKTSGAKKHGYRVTVTQPGVRATPYRSTKLP
jgi:hypothetical protein